VGEPAVNARYMKSIASALLALGERGLRVRAADPALFVDGPSPRARRST
jgi:hypothetical protein